LVTRISTPTQERQQVNEVAAQRTQLEQRHRQEIKALRDRRKQEREAAQKRQQQERNRKGSDQR
jgi:hypothetical protein